MGSYQMALGSCGAVSVTYPGGSVQLATSDDVQSAWTSVGTPVPLQYFLGTAAHETGGGNTAGPFKLNEVDLNDQSCGENPPNSYGIYQLSPSECASAGYTYNDALSLGPATTILAYIAGQRASQLRAALSLPDDGSGDPDGFSAWLAYAHNRGIGAAIPTAQQYGGDWYAYANANPGSSIVAYGNDCIGPWGAGMNSTAGLVLALGLAAALAYTLA